MVIDLAFQSATDCGTFCCTARDGSSYQRVRRCFRKRGVREGLAQVADLWGQQGRHWGLQQVVETVLAALVLQIRSCHRLEERTRTGLPVWVGGMRLAPTHEATRQWILPQVDATEVRQLLVDQGRAEGRRTSVVTPEGAIRTWAIDGTWLWSGRRGGWPECRVQCGVGGIAGCGGR